MEEIGQMNGELEKIIRNEYASALETVLLKTANVWKYVIYELCGEDFPALWAEQYRRAGHPFPNVERSSLLWIDQTRQIETAVNQYLVASDQPALDLDLRNRELPKQTRDIMRELPDNILVPAVYHWLQSLSEKELAETAQQLLNSFDVSGPAKCILYTVDPRTGRKAFLPRLQNRYGINRYEYEDQLGKFIQRRNDFLAHKTDNMLDTLRENRLFEILEEFYQMVQPFASSETLNVKEALADWNLYFRQEMEKLRLPPLTVTELERDMGIPSGELARALRSFSSLRAYIDPDCQVVCFLSPEEIKQYYSAYCYDARAAREMRAEPHEIQLEERGTLFLPKMGQYRGGRLTTGQTEELIRQFAMILDLDTLLSPSAMKMVAAGLSPILKRDEKCLLVDWGTLSHLYRMEQEAADPGDRKQAHAARLQLYHMQKMGLIRYVGSMDRCIDPDRSVLDFVRKHRDAPICVITANQSLAEQLNTIETPNCLCLTNWRDEGILVRTASRQRLSALCESATPSIGSAFAQESDPQKEVGAAPPFQTVASPEPVPERLPVDVPQAGTTVWDENGTPLQLTEALGQPGGEGTVYQTSRAGLVAKIYHAHHADSGRLEKLRAMRAIPMELDCVCWPRSLLFTKDKRFAGFLMTEAPRNVVEMGVSIFKLCGEHVQKNVLPGWDRLSIAKACVSVSATFAYLHERQILMGDVNPRNLLVSPTDPEKIYFVDCDSYQVGEYVCPVGMAEYSSPEILKRLALSKDGYATCPRTIEDEQFSLASLLFHMIMLGQTPFAAKNNEKIEDAIQTYSFAYRTKTNRGTDVPDGPYALIWNNTPPYIREKFASVFTGETKYSAAVWHTEFQRYVSSISSGRSTAELLPTKYYDATGTFFRDFTCVGCHEKANMAAEKYERLVKYHQPLLCNRCMSILWSMRDQPATIVCDGCHRRYQGSKYDKAMQEYGKRCFCSTCKDRRNALHR